MKAQPLPPGQSYSIGWPPRRAEAIAAAAPQPGHRSKAELMAKAKKQAGPREGNAFDSHKQIMPGTPTHPVPESVIKGGGK